MSSNRLWIMDGHNMIFAISRLERLQRSDRRDEARAGLVEELERFAIARGEKVLVVFDGNEMPSNPDAVRRPFFEVVYTRRGEGVADDRILHEARIGLERGRSVTVVTNDVRTLARDLPRGVRHVGVREFWLKHIEKRDAAEDGKRVEGDFSDVEREMLARAAPSGPALNVRAPIPASARLGSGAPGRPGSKAGPRADTEEGMRDRIRLKRERGRLRQQRRLERRSREARRH